MQRLSISIFCENCLSDNVIADSAKIYEEFGKQYPEFSTQCQNTSKALKELIGNSKFHSIYDTAQYEFFLPAFQYEEDLATIESYIKKISLQCLQQRMLRGLEQFLQLLNSQKQTKTAIDDVQASDSIVESCE